MCDYDAIGNGANRIFTNNSRVRNGDNPTTHLVLTGGTFQIGRHEDLKSLYAQLGTYLSHAGAEMICVSESRSAIFPMYFDLDLKLPLPTLSADAIQSVVRVMASQTLRFFPEESRGHLGRCVVLDKTGTATKDPETKLYKHGVHVHFPHILVEADTALQIRMGVLNGLTAYLGSWESILGTNPGKEWDNIVDDAVYRSTGGLRMIGAPKAVKCRACPPRSGNTAGCETCKGRNHCHLIDERVYKLCMVLDAQGERDPTYEHTLRRNFCTLLWACTVRNPEGNPPTEGYAVYPGCPRLPSSAAAGRKRKVTLQSVGGASRRTDRRYAQAMSDPEALRILRTHLVRYHENYARCLMEACRNGNTIRVNLRGDNAKYCLNKVGFHRSNNVYMEVVKFGKSACARMKCYCPCKTSEGRNGYGMPCSKFSEETKRYLDKTEIEILFASDRATLEREKHDKTLFGGTVDSMRSDEMTDVQFLELANGMFAESNTAS